VSDLGELLRGGKCLLLANYYEGQIKVKLNNMACMFTRGRLIIVD
jgi:hypothetical protein